ncbi:ABC transporter permease subunit [Ornithinimicrobium pekingense]|uniref:ABC transporter permease n=1 Tax=Ornithinimicrobium pekingense TaxID=384677 RepID=A0ABQ2F4E8_9MICO|nr:ABC transporter permease subunit [Ornithinimicrobium pekingense]GGK59956.1 ABC transporter permease [Ornithinimicrobium pekingense]
MTGLVRSELRKALTTKMAWGMPLAQFVLAAVFAAITGGFLLFVDIPGADGTPIPARELFEDGVLARMTYTGGLQVGYLLALVLGILAMGSEYRHKTLTATFLAEPRRGRVVAAKVVGLSVVVVLNGLAHLAGAVVGGGIMLLLADVPLFPDAGDLAGVMLRLLLVLVLWGLMGLGLGVLLPNQVVALFVGVAFAFLIEPLLSFGITFVDALADAARFFPSQASTAALSVFEGVDPATAQNMGFNPDQLDWWAAALTLLVYAAVMTAVGWVLTRRRDVA